MANKPQGPSPTYMTPEQFQALGQRCFGGPYGWHGKLGDYIGYHRIQVGRFANGHVAIPSPIAVTLTALAYCLDNGVPIDKLVPIGTIDQDGRFKVEHGHRPASEPILHFPEARWPNDVRVEEDAA